MQRPKYSGKGTLLLRVNGLVAQEQHLVLIEQITKLKGCRCRQLTGQVQSSDFSAQGSRQTHNLHHCHLPYSVLQYRQT